MRINLRGLFDKVASPKAFTSYALIGVGVTIAMAILNTRKQCEYENEKKSQEEKSENVVEEIKTTVNNYAPTIISAVATTYCINKAETKWIDYTGVINSAYNASATKLGQLRAAIPALAAKEALAGFSGEPPKEGLQWFCVHGAADHIVRFQSTMADVIYAEYCLNKRFTAHAMASVYDFFELLDILDQCRDDYDKLGWEVDRLIDDYQDDTYRECLWVEFIHRWHVDENTGEKIMSIDYVYPPAYDPEGRSYALPFEWNEIQAYNYPRE